MPRSRAARTDFRTSVFTTVAWNDAAISATWVRVECACPAHVKRHRRLDPAERESARRPWSSRWGIRGAGLPAGAARSITGPPGYPRPGAWRPCRRPRPRRRRASGRALIAARARAPRRARCGRPRRRARGTEGAIPFEERRRYGLRGGSPRRGACRGLGDRLGGGDPDESEPTNPGPWVTATASNGRPRPATPSARRSTGTDVLEVLARRQLRHDAAVGAWRSSWEDTS